MGLYAAGASAQDAKKQDAQSRLTEVFINNFVIPKDADMDASDPDHTYGGVQKLEINEALKSVLVHASLSYFVSDLDVGSIESPLYRAQFTIGLDKFSDAKFVVRKTAQLKPFAAEIMDGQTVVPEETMQKAFKQAFIAKCKQINSVKKNKAAAHVITPQLTQRMQYNLEMGVEFTVGNWLQYK